MVTSVSPRGSATPGRPLSLILIVDALIHTVIAIQLGGFTGNGSIFEVGEQFGVGGSNIMLVEWLIGDSAHDMACRKKFGHLIFGNQAAPIFTHKCVLLGVIIGWRMLGVVGVERNIGGFLSVGAWLGHYWS